MTPVAQPLIAELDAALDCAAESWRGTTLRRLTDLFLAGASSYTPEQVAVFDEVMERLMQKIDRRSLVELSGNLAAIENAPAKVIGSLARHVDMLVAEPVLRSSNVLSEQDLVEIAGNAGKNFALLSRIAERPRLGRVITDVLIQCGNPGVARKVIDNAGAEISELGFAKLVSGAERDRELAAAISKRDDLPPELRPWITAALGQGVQSDAPGG
jgi:uncharacterized protein (DUF2336 family)